MTLPTVTRRLYCYELKFFDAEEKLIENPEVLFSRFIRRKGQKLVNNLFQISPTEWLLMVVEQIIPHQVKGFYSKLRYELPQLIDLDEEKITELILNQNTTLIEICHFTYYTDEFVLIGEYNHYGPRHFSRLPEYMEMFEKDRFEKCQLLPILNADALTRLQNGVNISNFNIKVAFPSVGFLEKILGIELGYQEVLTTVVENYNGTNLEIIISGDRKQKLHTGLVKALGEKLNKVIKGKEEDIKKASIVCSEGKIDLLKDDLFEDVTVQSLSENSRHINSVDMYRSIHNFYINNREYFKQFSDKGEETSLLLPGDDTYVYKEATPKVVG